MSLIISADHCGTTIERQWSVSGLNQPFILLPSMRGWRLNLDPGGHRTSGPGLYLYFRVRFHPLKAPLWSSLHAWIILQLNVFTFDYLLYDMERRVRLCYWDRDRCRASLCLCYKGERERKSLNTEPPKPHNGLTISTGIRGLFQPP